MFKIEINSQKKLFHVTTSGFFTLSEAQAYVDDFKNKAKTIDASQYVLLINGKDQKTASTEVATLLESAMDLYMKTPFKKRYSVVMDSVVTMQQIKRLGNKELLNSFKFFNSEEEALRQL